MLAESDGLTTATLAKQAGADRDQVLTLLRDLETLGRVHRTGERRATRWHAIIDADRIQKASRGAGQPQQAPRWSPTVVTGSASGARTG